jgi:cysteinyl-tRNA synthetase
VHNGFVEVGGEKMSKSLGNFTNLVDLIDTTDPRAYRLLVLRAHYRSPVEVNKETTDDAVAALERLDALARRAATLPDAAADEASLAEFRDAMDDDLDTPRVMGLLFSLVRQANQLADDGDGTAAASLAAAVLEIGAAVGLELRSATGEVPEDIVSLATQRDEARAAKDWATADRLRDEIQAAGFLVEDTPAGTVVRIP